MQIEITDMGGIAAEHLHPVFERFYRVDQEGSRDARGSGISSGIGIARALIKAQGGHVQAQSPRPGPPPSSSAWPASSQPEASTPGGCAGCVTDTSRT